MADNQSTDTRPRAGLPPEPNRAAAAVQAVIVGFDRVGKTGQHRIGGEYPRRMLVEIHGANDPTRDPRFLGDPPERLRNGTCSFCGRPWVGHWDQDREEYVDGRDWHRLDRNPDGFYSDDIPAVTR
ncbi:hypothetical protein [Actinocrispum wychmicini]|uniref:Uncharacterized protein n=1 Tax=Actinocrispum wychmicini TaxID=1213861 RepID=A0A4R2JCB9_9PSEU|nr:hypothetical protein [Actinocrispum wychmicini]TCO57193.1 hypothetical protein EV192_106670 [Actinocrispum wychmicini]